MPEPIQFFNRYAKSIETEAIYGERYLRWIYENPFGRIALNALVKRSAFSNWYGWRMDRPASRRKIRPFIETYGIDMDECDRRADDFNSFNEFFYRNLKPEARPVAGDPDVACLPADGRHLVVPDLARTDSVYVKGQVFDLPSFLGDPEIAERFAGGSMSISRLCPVDYHRFHAPVSGKIRRITDIEGPLYSVSPLALRRNLGYLWSNKRTLVLIDSPDFGEVAFVAIGATCVGRIHFTKTTGESVDKGGELGYFAFGGSCVATLFQRGRARLAEDLASYSEKRLEVYAKMGDRLAARIRESGR